jgi:hypothetical protein
VFNLPEEMLGRKLRCKKCREVFLAQETQSPAEDEDLDDVAEEEPKSDPRAVRPRSAPSTSSMPRAEAKSPPQVRQSDDVVIKPGPSPVFWILAALGFAAVVLAAGGTAFALMLMKAREQIATAPGQGNFPQVARIGEGGQPAIRKDDQPGFGDLAKERAQRGLQPAAPEAKVPAGAFEMPPLPDPIDMAPAPIQATTTYKLPAPVESIRVGGGGRFLILHFPSTRKLGIFDMNEAKIVRYIPVPGDDVLFAGGMTRLVLYMSGSNVYRVHSLLTGEREKSGKLDLPAGKVEAFCMGYASDGPLLAGVANSGARLYDIRTFREIPLPSNAQNAVFPDQTTRRLEGGLYWAGATGRVFGHTGNYGMPNGIKSVVIEGSKVQEFGEHQGTWYVMPGPDDKHLYPGGYGVMSVQVRPVQNVAFSMGERSGYASHLYLPALQGPYYMHLQTIEDPIGRITVYMLGDRQPLMSFQRTALCAYNDWSKLGKLGIENSVYLNPKAKVLVVVPAGHDELRLYPADLDAALEHSNREYLYFASSPPATFQSGKTFEYQAEAKAKKKPLVFSLATAPDGMKVDNTGKVTWQVPADFADRRVDVILSAKDANGKEVFQTITLTQGKGS